MYKATFKNLASRKLRLVLSALAVVLGVMFVSGSFVLTDSLGKSFDKLFASVNENLDVQVTPTPKLDEMQGGPPTGTLPISLVEKIRAVDGVESAVPGVYTQNARVIGKDGKVVPTFGAPQSGQDWQGENGLVELREGRGPVKADEIAIDAALAKTSGYDIGDRVGVLTLQPKKMFTIVGIFGYSGGRDTLGGSQATAFTMAAAQELLLGEKDAVSVVDVVAEDGVTPEKLRDEVKAAVGADYRVMTAEETSEDQAAGFKTFLNFFTYVLLGFAGVALFVGIFLILNTFSMLVAQRTRELALMRAIGASRGQVVNSVLLEATVIGLVASVVGLAAGVGVGALLAFAFSKFAGTQDLAIGVPVPAVIASFVVGLGVTLVAATVPAVRASRIPPVAAMRDAATPDKPLTTITVVGGVVTAAGAVATGFALYGDAGLWLLLVGVVLAFVGVALLTPVLSRPVVSLLGRLFSWSTPGKLGRRNSARNPRRTAVTAGALMVSIALVTGVSTILASAKTSIGEAVDSQLSADLVISGGPQTGPTPKTFDAAVLDRIDGMDGVERVAGLYQSMGTVDGDRTFFGAVSDLPAAAEILGLKVASGSLGALGDRELVIDEAGAKARKLSVGDTVRIQLPKGDETAYTVAGVYAENEASNGILLPASAARNFAAPAPTMGLLQLAGNADVEVVRAEVAKLLADSPEVTVADRSEFVDQTTATFDQVLMFIQILLALAIVIAVLGIVNTLALSVIERTREIGLLRAIGLKRGQTMRMITVESVVISLFGTLLGIVVGIGLGAAVVTALADEGFTTLSLPWSEMVTYLVAAGVIGVVAAVVPAVRAARLNVLSAISYE